MHRRESASSSGPELRELDPTLLLGFRPDVQFAPFYVAQQEGFYADAGLDVTIEHKQAPDVQRLVADGQAEFGVADATDVMIARTAGIPIKLRVAPCTRPSRSRSSGPQPTCRPIRPSWPGRAIGTPGRFGSSWHALLALLDAGGLTGDDVTIREYPQFNQVDGLVNGDVELITGFRNNEPLRLEARGDRGRAADGRRRRSAARARGSSSATSCWPPIPSSFAPSSRPRPRHRPRSSPIRTSALRRRRWRCPTIAEDPDVARAVLDATIELWRGDGVRGRPHPGATLWRSGYETMVRLGFIDGSVPVEEMIAPEIAGGG